MPVYRAETKFSTKKAGYSALSCVTAMFDVGGTGVKYAALGEKG